MKRQIVIHPDAVHDLDEQAEYLSQHRRDLGFRFNESAQKAFRQLARMPGLSSPYPTANPRLDNLRCSAVPGFKNWLIFYRPTDFGIQVLRVLHGARDIASLLEAEEENDDASPGGS